MFPTGLSLVIDYMIFIATVYGSRQLSWHYSSYLTMLFNSALSCTSIKCLIPLFWELVFVFSIVINIINGISIDENSGGPPVKNFHKTALVDKTKRSTTGNWHLILFFEKTSRDFLSGITDEWRRRHYLFFKRKTHANHSRAFYFFFSFSPESW